MNKRMFLLLITFALIVLLSISSKSNREFYAYNYHKVQDNVSDSLITLWKEDSCGCLNYRTPRMMSEIIKLRELNTIDIDSFESVFGKANERVEGKTGTTLVYYYNSYCFNGVFLKLPEGYCQIEVLFSNKGLPTEFEDGCF